MGPIKHPQCDPDHDSEPVQASPENDCQNNARSVYLVKKNTFNWDLLVQESSPVSQCYCGRGKPLDLEQSTRKRVMKVAEKEDTLVDLSKTAAEAAKKREEELRKQSAILREQPEKIKVQHN